MINSRSETIMEKPSFRTAFKKQRLLIPADGFYEWQKKKEGGKQPYYIHMQDEKPFALAGLWENWKGPEGQIVESCSIITTDANSLLKPIHGRMPVIINPNDFDLWLNPEVQEPDKVKPLLKAYDSKKMAAYPVSSYVNKPENRGEETIKPFEEKFKQQKLF